MIDLQILIAIFDASEFFGWFVEHANYLFVFVFMVIESSFIPFPSELVVPPAAYLATAQGSSSDMNIYIIVLVATAGAMVGSMINYFLALFLGRPIVYSFANSKLGHACLINTEKVDKAENYFDKHGAISTFIGRLIPAVRQLISIPAGLSRMNFGKFCLYTFLGAGLWNAILAALGYWLGKTVSLDNLMNKIEEYNSYLSYAGIILGLACIGFLIYNAYKPKGKQHTSKKHNN